MLRNNEGNIIHSFGCMNDQENDDIELLETEEEIVEESFNQELPSDLLQDSVSNRDTCPVLLTNQNLPVEVSDDQFCESVRCLNIAQRQAFDMVLSWCRSTMKNLNSLKPQEAKPIYLFVSGGGGAGKSHLIKAIYQTAIKTLKHAPIQPERRTVLLTVPTGVAAINIDVTTIYSGLSIPKNTGYTLPAMSDQ